MSFKLSECECRLEYNCGLRKYELEMAVKHGNIEKLQEVLQHIIKYDCFSDPNTIFRNVEARLKIAPLSKRLVADQLEMQREIAAARKAIEDHRAYLTAGIPPRRSKKIPD